MGRTVTAEIYLENHFATICADIDTRWIIGLLIGQTYNEKDFITLAVTCPSIVEKQNSDFNEVQLDDHRVYEHVREVTKMLVGGQVVRGVFVVADAAQVTNKTLPKIRSLLSTIPKASSMSSALQDISSPRKLFLHLCPKSKRITCKALNIADPQSFFEPAEWNYQSFLLSWNTFSCLYKLAMRSPVKLSSKKSLYKHISEGLQDTLDVIQNADYLSDGRLPNGLNKAISERSKARDGKANGRELFITLLTKPIARSKLDVEAKALLRIGGTIMGRAVVHPKASEADAVKELKMDFSRSLLSRIHLLCDGDDLGDAGLSELSVTTPKRVFCRVMDCRELICDYMFPEEKLEDVACSIAEMLNLTITEDHLVPDLESLSSSHAGFVDGNGAATVITKQPGNTRKTLLVLGALSSIFSVVVALVLLVYVGN